MSDTKSLTYGLNESGFVRMRMPEIRRAIYNDIKSRTQIDLEETPDFFTGQFINIFAEREAALWELAEATFLARYPTTAQGVALDLSVAFSGVQRLQPARSQAVIYLIGAPGTIVPVGTIIQATTGDDAADTPPRFLLQSDITLTKQAVVGAILSVQSNVVAGNVYWIEAAGVRYSVTAQVGQNSAQVASALKNIMGDLSTVNGDVITLYQQTEFIINWSATIDIQSIMCVGVVVSQDFGKINATERVISNIITKTDGLYSAYNPYAVTLGQLIETDSEIRDRYSLGVYRLGAGTQPSITANLKQNIAGVSSVRVFVNETGVMDGDGRPPHSIEAIIEGGDQDAIIRELHRVKGGGITSYGNTSGTVTDEDGYKHPISFSRPEPRWVWLRISYGVNPEATVTGDVAGMAIDAVLKAGNKLLPGDDLIIQKLEAAPFAVSDALSRVTITAAVTASNAIAPTNYSAANVSMNSRQKAVFDISRISVI